MTLLFRPESLGASVSGAQHLTGDGHCLDGR